MSLELLATIERLRCDGLLSAPAADTLTRILRRQLVSVQTELRIALYAGVLLL